MRPVKLTWLDDDGVERTDNLFLMEDGDKFFGENVEGEILPLTLDDINDPGDIPLVWFGGLDGLVMGIEPQYVVNIEPMGAIDPDALKVIQDILDNHPPKETE